MVFFKELRVRHGVRLGMMLTAQRQRFHALVQDVRAVSAHADPVDVMQLGQTAAHRAFLVNQAVIDVIMNVVDVLDERPRGLDAVFDDKPHQEPLKPRDQAHRRVGQRENPVPQLVKVVRHEMQLEQLFGAFLAVADVIRNEPQKRVAHVALAV